MYHFSLLPTSGNRTGVGATTGSLRLETQAHPFTHLGFNMRSAKRYIYRFVKPRMGTVPTRVCEHCEISFYDFGDERPCPVCRDERPKPRKYKGRKDAYTAWYGQTWRDVRKAVLERDGFQCVECGLSNEEHRARQDLFPPQGGLHIHHIIDAHEFDTYEEANQLDNLVSLCARCHNQH